MKEMTMFDQNIQEAHEEIHPWIRFFARQIDLWIFITIINLSMDKFSLSIPFAHNIYLESFVLLVFWLVIETFLLATCGTTIGKYLFNIRIINKSAKKLSLSKAYYRCLYVWIFGYGLGVPFINLFTFGMSYSHLSIKGKTRWDEDNEIRVLHGDINDIRKLMIILIAIAIIFFQLHINDSQVLVFYGENFK